MIVFDEEAALPYAPDVVFRNVVDVANAPYWHWWFHDVQQIGGTEIGTGSRWCVIYRLFGWRISHYFELIQYEPDHILRFRGGRIMGVEPVFSFQFSPTSTGTHIHFIVQPHMYPLLEILFRWVAVPYGKLEMRRYFHNLEAQLALFERGQSRP